MGQIRAANLLQPGSYGLNTRDPIADDQVLRYCSLASNGLIDASGKLVSREDFVNQTAGFTGVVDVVYTHKLDAGTEAVISAASGVIYSGISSLTSRFDYRAGAQVVDVGGAKAGASSTGLANSAEVYGFTVAVDGGAAQQISVTGSAAQTWTNLLAEINTDLTGATAVLVGGNLKIISETTGASSSISIANTAGTASNALLSTLTSFVAVRTAAAGTLTNDNWQFASMNGKLYGAQAGQPFLVLTDAYAVTSIVGQPWTSSPNCVIAAYGRIWAADDAAGSERGTLWWSDILDGTTWNSGTAGEISLKNAWPAGEDTITAICAAFGRIIVFGKSSILMYTLPSSNDPDSMTLTHTITNVGCVARDSVVVAGDGVYFLSANGIMRIDALAQVTSLMSTLTVSTLIGGDVQSTYASETLTAVRGGYNPKLGIYVLNAPTANKCYVAHLNTKLPQLNLPAFTTWTNVGMPFRGFCYDASGNWYCAGTNGVHKYSGYTTDGANNVYTFAFYTQWLNFGDESRLKHLKYIVLTLEAVSGQAGTFNWQIDEKSGTTYTSSFTCSAVEFAENPGIGETKAHIGRSCNVAKFGFTFTVTAKITLHQIKLFAQTGKTTFR